MTNRQRAKLDSFNRVTDFDTNNAVVLAAITEYAAEQSIFDAAVLAIKSAGNIMAPIAGAESINAADMKQQMADIIIMYSLRGMVKARQLGNGMLADQLDEPVSYVYHAAKTEAIARAQSQRNLLNDNLATLTNITAGNIADIDAAIANYNSNKDLPTETRQLKKASGTNVVPAQMAIADAALDNMYSLVRSYLSISNPSLVNAFELAMQVISTGVHHTVSDFTILEDENGNPLAGAAITDVGSGKIYTTDASGFIDIGTHRTGNFNFTISATGRQSVNFGADILRGKHNSFTVRLKTL